MRNLELAERMQQGATSEPNENQKQAAPVKTHAKTKHVVKRKITTDDMRVAFQTRAVDVPLYIIVANIFGVAGEQLGAVDRNTMQHLIELTSEKLHTADEKKILRFIRNESHKYPGEYRFREMRRVLALGK